MSGTGWRVRRWCSRRAAEGLPDHARGERELVEWLRTPPDLSLPPRDELVIKILVAWRLPGVDVHEVIQTRRRYLVELMQQWTRLKEDQAQFDLGFALAVDAELFRLDSAVRWLDTADSRFRHATAERAAPVASAMPRPRRRTAVRP